MLRNQPVFCFFAWQRLLTKTSLPIHDLHDLCLIIHSYVQMILRTSCVTSSSTIQTSVTQQGFATSLSTTWSAICVVHYNSLSVNMFGWQPITFLDCDEHYPAPLQHYTTILLQSTKFWLTYLPICLKLELTVLNNKLKDVTLIQITFRSLFHYVWFLSCFIVTVEFLCLNVILWTCATLV